MDERDQDPETEARPYQGPPHKSPEVVHAVQLASRGDPHPDPLKPVARGAFFIWVVILVSLVCAGLGSKVFADRNGLAAQVNGAFHGLTEDARSRRQVMRELDRNPHKLEIMTVTGLAAGSLVFALYYLGVYLIVLPTSRGAAGLYDGLAARSRRRPKRRIEPDIGPRGSGRAGPEPYLE